MSLRQRTSTLAEGTEHVALAPPAVQTNNENARPHQQTMLAAFKTKVQSITKRTNPTKPAASATKTADAMPNQRKPLADIKNIIISGTSTTSQAKPQRITTAPTQPARASVSAASATSGLVALPSAAPTSGLAKPRISGLARLIPQPKKNTVTHSAPVTVRRTTSTHSETVPDAVSGTTIPPGVKDIDVEARRNPQFVAEYAEDIMDYLRQRQREEGVLPSCDYLSRQPELTEHMRARIVDWMLEVHTTYRLLPETFCLSVNLLDRYLTKNVVSKSKFQLVSLAAMLVASKYEEIMPPQVKDFVYIVDDGYTAAELLQMEKSLLNTIAFDLGVPLTLTFLRRYSRAAGSDARVHALGKYLLEAALLDYNMLQYLPSVVAAAAVYLARKMVASASPAEVGGASYTFAEFWPASLVYYTKHHETDILPAARALTAFLKRWPMELESSLQEDTPVHALRVKYLDPRNLCVAAIPLVDV